MRCGHPSEGFFFGLASHDRASEVGIYRRISILADGVETGEQEPEPRVPAKRLLSAAHRRKLAKALAKARRARWAKAKSNGIVKSLPLGNSSTGFYSPKGGVLRSFCFQRRSTTFSCEWPDAEAVRGGSPDLIGVNSFDISRGFPKPGGLRIAVWTTGAGASLLTGFVMISLLDKSKIERFRNTICSKFLIAGKLRQHDEHSGRFPNAAHRVSF